MKVVLQRNLFERSFDVFSEAERTHGVEFFLTDVLDENTMLEYHKKGSNCFVIGAEAYSSNFYQSLSAGSLVIRYGVGYNAVPIGICKERGVSVAYTPGTLTDSVAEYTFALLLSLCRNTILLDNSMKRNEWNGLGGFELKGKTIAIIGFGQIGQAVARIAKYGYGMRIHAFDKYISHNELADFASTVFAEVVKDADIVSLHMSSTKETAGFINQQSLSLFKEGAVLLNTSRGELVNEKDLFKALLDKKIQSAALDVFINEPYVPTENADFRKLPNVLLTPHCGSNTKEANRNMAEAVVENIIAFRDGGKITSIPELIS